MRGGPNASSPSALRRMQSTRQRDTAPELSLRRALHACGLRFRVNRAVMPGSRRVDVVFGPAKVAVFVDGCFWHLCPLHRSFPKANARWWLEKLRMNHQRDLDTNRQLRKAGWHVERVWEHESIEKAARRIVAVVRCRRKSYVADAAACRRGPTARLTSRSVW